MSEQPPVYCLDATTFTDAEPQTIQGGPRVVPMPGDSVDLLMLYFIRRRDVLIAELRELDRLMGRPQTVPERGR